MSRLQTFTLPDVGEGLTEAEILSWHVAVGDTLTVNQIMVEIETAKAAVELPSPYAGRVHKLLAEPGVTIAVGTPILQIDTDPDAGPLADDGPAGGAAPQSGGDPGGAAAGGAAADGAAASGAGGQSNAGEEAGTKIGETMADGRVATLVGYIPAGGGSARRPRKAAAGQATGVVSTAQPEASPAAPAPAPSAPAMSPSLHAAPAPGSSRAPLATPPVRKLAKDLGVDLRTVHATRSDGVISRADVEAAVAGAGAWDASAGDGEAPAAAGRAVADYDPATREQRVPIKGVRKMTAAAVVSSAFTAPHVTEFLTVDVTPMMQLRDRLRKRREFADVRITPLTFAARAVCIAARRTPAVNATWDGDAGDIVYKQYLHLGIAAATPRGLIVPNIKDADQLDLLGLAEAISALTETARSGKTALTAMAGGTITITNVGVFGVDTGTPIINLGESAILALGSVKDAPWVVDGVLAVRKVCQLALSFDHRVVDGQQGSEFLADVGALLADPALAMAL